MIKTYRYILGLFFAVYVMPFFAGGHCEGICKTVKEEIQKGEFTWTVNECERKVLDAYIVYPKQMQDQSDYQKATALFTFLKNGTLQSTNQPIFIAGKPAFVTPEKEMSELRSACPGGMRDCMHTDTSFELTEVTDKMLKKQTVGQKIEELDLINWKVEASVPSSKRCTGFTKTEKLNSCARVVSREKIPWIREPQGDNLGWGIEEEHMKLATNNYFYTQKFINRIQWFGTSANKCMIQAAKSELEEPKLDTKRTCLAMGGAVAFFGALTGGLKLWSAYNSRK